MAAVLARTDREHALNIQQADRPNWRSTRHVRLGLKFSTQVGSEGRFRPAYPDGFNQSTNVFGF
jgi:hypothetical protein